MCRYRTYLYAYMMVKICNEESWSMFFNGERRFCLCSKIICRIFLYEHSEADYDYIHIHIYTTEYGEMLPLSRTLAG